MKQREELKKKVEQELGEVNDDELQAEVKQLREEIKQLKSRPGSPDAKMKQKMAKLQKSWKAKIDDAEARLGKAEEVNQQLQAQLEKQFLIGCMLDKLNWPNI